MRNKKNGVQDILKKSTSAQCGIMEREVTVPSTKVTKTINKLKNAGYFIVGTSYGDSKRKKVWFSPRVSL